MILSISWKNVWRNKVRSMVVIVAVTLGLIGGIFGGALMEGMMQQRIDAAINLEVSHIQLHHVDFGRDKDPKYKMNNIDKKLDKILSLDKVKAASARTKHNVVVSTARSNAGVTLLGINPETEKKVSQISNNIIEGTGSYFESNAKNQILISEKTAKSLKLVYYIINWKVLDTLKNLDIPQSCIKALRNSDTTQIFRTDEMFSSYLDHTLGVEKANEHKYLLMDITKSYKLRSKINVRMRDDNGNEVVSAFRITGLYNTENKMFDEYNAFVRWEDIHRITGMSESQAHEIAVLLHNTEDTETVLQKITEKMPKNISVKSWGDISPDLKVFSGYMGIMSYVFIVIILLALGFGIVNTMLMVVLERVKELGMLMSIGMNKVKVFWMIILESVFLSLTGAIAGMAASALIVSYFETNGLNLGAANTEAFEAVGYSAIIYPSIDNTFYIGVTILVILTGILASVYPAIKAIRRNPVDAIRME